MSFVGNKLVKPIVIQRHYGMKWPQEEIKITNTSEESAFVEATARMIEEHGKEMMTLISHASPAENTDYPYYFVQWPPKEEVSPPVSQTCVCESRELAAFGCKCGWFQKEMKAKRK